MRLAGTRADYGVMINVRLYKRLARSVVVVVDNSQCQSELFPYPRPLGIKKGVVHR